MQADAHCICEGAKDDLYNSLSSLQALDQRLTAHKLQRRPAKASIRQQHVDKYYLTCSGDMGGAGV